VLLAVAQGTGDAVDLIDMKVDDAVRYIRGKKGTEVRLTVKKADGTRKIISIVRDVVQVAASFAKSSVLEYKDSDVKVGYIQLPKFYRDFDNATVNCTDDVKKELERLKKAKVDAVILDLRNNPGGLLNQAISVVDMFVKNGVIVSQKGRDVADEEKFEANKLGFKTDLPLVVLVNEGSASASEIVSGSLQDHKRAVIIGEKTFGKGSVQAVLPIENDRSENIKLTIAKYYLPSGRTIQATGVTPDVIVNSGKVTQDEEDKFKIKEADLKKHLEGELEKVATTKKEEKAVIDENKKVITSEDVLADNQLNTSIAILKSLIIMNK
jgi:carboxyl-terminal processing protease